ncbi:MAG: hypothetical protein KF703_08205 [Actinobacteria bacterium]|nr:hypothetical protein [Actinomycetota bacterium]
MGGTVDRVVKGVNRRMGLARKRRWERQAEAGHKAPVIIYSLPKTAGSTLHQSLQVPAVGAPVLHVHILSDDGMAQIDRELALGLRTRPRPEKRRIMDRARAAFDDPDQRPVVIAGTRHPLDRAVSSFFQGWSQDFPWVGEEDGVRPEGVAELIELFHERLPELVAFADSWFDTELGAVAGFDAFGVPFTGDGWQRHSCDTCELAIVGTEDLDRVVAAMTTDLFGTAVPLKQTNVGTAKPYRDYYRAFTDALRLSPAEADAVRNTRHARHFYRAEEIEPRLARFQATS